MIFRAVFAIAFVAVFIPHEPDLGLGRPSTASTPSFEMSELAGAAQMCGSSQGACATGLNLVGGIRSTILSNLDRVKAELKVSEQARSDQRRTIGSDLVALIGDF